MHIGAAIDGAGSHPAAHRSTPAAPYELFTAAHYAHSARLAERATLDYVTLDDSFAAPGRPGVPGRPDALLTLAALAPVTSGIGLVPTVTTTHTEPFHVSKGIASLDHASRGRAGWLVEVSDTEDDARLVGRRPVAPAEELWNEAGAVVDAASALWDSWEDGAEIRDVATGRFIDRDRLHYVDHEYVRREDARPEDGPHAEDTGWTVRGPSITPRPPQGHPVVFVRADTDDRLRTAARYADAVLIRARTPERAAQRRAEVHRAVRGAGRDPGQVRVLADLGIVLDRDRRIAEERSARLDALVPGDGAPETGARGTGISGAKPSAPSRPAATFAGTPRDLAREIEAWSEAVDGLTLRPAVLPVDLERFAADTVPLLKEAGILRTARTADTLRGNLGLRRPANRHAPTARTAPTAPASEGAPR
ncbi:LLM class flavin-dependent oxidoreductase [Nocardiopsis sp. HNM0947]|uniref:LLM class flavin-dependent oxidoreductase n=1 Tax=Nocardiopsis coralli TaxID=2772213 RepID=A0ABR9P3Q5_9ACTN|nr:LLM class flavin-dependent oxidoreductase [Nocardiopsis coralli]